MTCTQYDHEGPVTVVGTEPIDNAVGLTLKCEECGAETESSVSIEDLEWSEPERDVLPPIDGLTAYLALTKIAAVMTCPYEWSADTPEAVWEVLDDYGFKMPDQEWTDEHEHLLPYELADARETDGFSPPFFRRGTEIRFGEGEQDYDMIESWRGCVIDVNGAAVEVLGAKRTEDGAGQWGIEALFDEDTGTTFGDRVVLDFHGSVITLY